MGFSVTNLLQIYQGIFQWKHFVNRLRLGRIMAVSLWPRFFGPPCMSASRQPVCGARQSEVEGMWYNTWLLHRTTRPSVSVEGLTIREIASPTLKNARSRHSTLVFFPCLYHCIIVQFTQQFIIQPLKAASVLGRISCQLSYSHSRNSHTLS